MCQYIPVYGSRNTYAHAVLRPWAIAESAGTEMKLAV